MIKGRSLESELTPPLTGFCDLREFSLSVPVCSLYNKNDNLVGLLRFSELNNIKTFRTLASPQ